MSLTSTSVLKDETKMAAKALDGIRKLFSQMNFNNVAVIGSRHCLKLDFLTSRTQWEILFSLLETLHMVQLRGGAQVEHVRGRTHDVHSLALNSLDNWSIHRFTRALSDITKTLYQGDGRGKTRLIELGRCCHTHLLCVVSGKVQCCACVTAQHVTGGVKYGRENKYFKNW